VPVQVISHVEMPIQREDDVVLVRRRVRELAAQQRFDSFATAAITTAASELTRNVWVHAKGGVAVLEEVDANGRIGIRASFCDDGPGIANVERALSGGFSTARSLGLGLSGSRRLVDDFTIETGDGRGTVVTFVKWRPY
jgi:serine/threonine-protein kinase RsbT